MHVLGAGVFARVGDILDLPEHVAIERISNGSCEPAPAPPEPAPEAPAGEEGQLSGEGQGEGTDEITDETADGDEGSEDSGDDGQDETTDSAGGTPKKGRGKKEKAK
jgi:hypothetical protein